MLQDVPKYTCASFFYRNTKTSFFSASFFFKVELAKKPATLKKAKMMKTLRTLKTVKTSPRRIAVVVTAGVMSVGVAAQCLLWRHDAERLDRRHGRLLQMIDDKTHLDRVQVSGIVADRAWSTRHDGIWMDSTAARKSSFVLLHACALALRHKWTEHDNIVEHPIAIAKAEEIVRRLEPWCTNYTGFWLHTPVALFVFHRCFVQWRKEFSLFRLEKKRQPTNQL